MAVLVWNELFNIRAAVDMKKLNQTGPQTSSSHLMLEAISYLVDFDRLLGVASSFTIHAYSFGVRSCNIIICNASCYTVEF